MRIWIWINHPQPHSCRLPSKREEVVIWKITITSPWRILTWARSIIFNWLMFTVLTLTQWSRGVWVRLIWINLLIRVGCHWLWLRRTHLSRILRSILILGSPVFIWLCLIRRIQTGARLKCLRHLSRIGIVNNSKLHAHHHLQIILLWNPMVHQTKKQSKNNVGRVQYPNDLTQPVPPT